jgi:Fe-S oxidoreductase
MERLKRLGRLERLGAAQVSPSPQSPQSPQSLQSPPPTGKTVILFHDTWTNFNERSIGIAALRLLEAAGYIVHLAAGRKCCGRPLITGGQASKAKAWVDHNVALLAPYAHQGLPIVGIEPSCILTLRDEYLSLASDQKRAQILATNAFTVEEFIVREMKAGRFAAAWRPRPGKALLHGHCHHKALVGNEPSVAALKAAGYDVEVIPSGCCGMAGDFGYEISHYEISRAIGEDRLFPAVRSAALETVIVASGTSCRHQIVHFTRRHPVHLVEALAAALA